MAKNSSYFKTVVDINEQNNRSIHVEVGPNLEIQDAVLSVAVLLNTISSVYKCSVNDLLVSVVEAASSVHREKMVHGSGTAEAEFEEDDECISGLMN